MSTKNEPKFEFRAPKAGEWYLDAYDMAVPTYAAETLDTKQWVVVKPVPKPAPGPEPAPWPGPEHEVIVITGINGCKSPQRMLALRNILGDYRDEDGRMWCKNDREYDLSYITSWEPYQPSPERREYTADELDNLPEGACAWDEYGDVWQRGASDWFVAAGYAISNNPLREGIRDRLYSAPPEGHR